MLKFSEDYEESVVFTVRELKELLDRFEDTDFVNFYGGESEDGEFCAITVADNLRDLW